MPAAAVSYSPTGGYSKSFLERVWANRKQLIEEERRGFVQLLYLSACSHIEHVLQELICARLQFVSERIDWTTSNLQTVHGPVLRDPEGLNPVSRTITRIADSFIIKTRKAPFNELRKIYDIIYPTPFRTVVGPDLLKDLEALVNLRNHLAHGRQLIVEFEAPPPYARTEHDRLEANVSNTPLRLAYERLKVSGIPIREVVTLANRHEWLALIYSDAAAKYFLNSCSQAEGRLLSANAFCGEVSMINIPPLPSFE